MSRDKKIKVFKYTGKIKKYLIKYYMSITYSYMSIDIHIYELYKHEDTNI